jgi:plastocyanin
MLVRMGCIVSRWSWSVVGRAAVAMAAASGALGAQGTVAGTISVLERTGTTKDLADAVVYLTRAGSGAPKSGPTRIAMHDREFSPHVRVVTVGSDVGFPNDDPFRHNVFSNAGPSAFDLGLYERGQSRNAAFPRAGVYPIFCNIHAKMSAFVIVVNTPYFTQPSADGRFSLERVPAGAYTLHVWHERGGQHSREITVGADATPDVQVQLDARTFTLVAHKNKFGKDYPPARDRY